MNIQSNNPIVPIQGRITQVSPSQAKVNPEAPASDGVLDLSQAANLEGELQTQNAGNTDFIRLSENTALSVQELSPEELTHLIDNLKSRALDGDLKLLPGISPQNLISVEGTTVTIAGQGTALNPTPESSPIEQAEAVIAKSNANPDDKTWAFANGTSGSLSFQKAADKPAPWNNHLFMADDKAFVYQTGTDKRTVALPGEQTLQLDLNQAEKMGLPKELLEEVKQTGALRYLPKNDYQNMLKNDFNFNDAFSKFQSPEQFREALQYTYPDRVEALGQANFDELAERVYSYASNAQDTDGNIDVQKMQGMLYALDPEIRLSSNSNTPMKAQNLFTIDQAAYEQLPANVQKNYAASNTGEFVPLSIDRQQYETLSAENKALFTPLGDRYIPLGDNKHGRATILTTRHIMENVNTTEIPNPPASFQFQTGISSLFGENDRFIRDSSGSMTEKWGAMQRSVDKLLQQQGTLKANESLANKVDLKVQQNGSLALNGRDIQVDRNTLNGNGLTFQNDDLPQVLSDAYDSFKTADKSDAENRQAFSEFVGVPETEIFDANTGNIKTTNSHLLKSFDKLLHQQGRLKPGQALKDHLDVLVNPNGSLNLSATKTYTPELATLDDDAFDAYIQDFSNVLTDAYQTLSSPDKSSAENQQAFADLLGVPASQIFNRQGQLEADPLMDMLGDQSGVLSGRNIGSTGEAAFKGIITTLLFDQDYTDKSRMNVLIDEPLQDMEYLKLAQALAEAKGVDVRFISMPTNPESTEAVEKNPEDFMIFVDLQSMQLNTQNGQPQSLSFTAQHVDDQGIIQDTPQNMPVEYYQGKVHDRNVDYSANPQGFKGAFVPLQGYDANGKPINKIGAGSE